MTDDPAVYVDSFDLHRCAPADLDAAGAIVFTREYRYGVATVGSPQGLREAVNEKLAAANDSIQELRRAEQPEYNSAQSPKQSVVDFLHAAHGVVPVIETFANGRQQHRKDFEDWRKRWEAQLTDEERTLWLTMLDARVAQEHGVGAGLEAIWIPITRGLMPEDLTNYALTGTQPSVRRKSGVQIRAYPGRTASEVCRQYLELVRRFWRDFEARHPHLF